MTTIPKHAPEQGSHAKVEIHSQPHATTESSKFIKTTSHKPTSRIMEPTFIRRLFVFVVAFIMRVVSHFWRMCTAGTLVLVLSYWVYGGWLFFSLFCFSFLGLLYHCQDLLLYFPDQPPTSRLYVDLPSTVNLPYEEHFIRSVDGVLLNAFFLKHTDSFNRPTILYLHGNAGNIGNRILDAHGLFHTCGSNVFLLEYRGYGRSEGSPSETGLYNDATAGLKFLLDRTDINTKRIVVFGRSLGGAVAIYLASTSPHSSHISGLILENTFTSIQDIAAVVFRFPLILYVPSVFVKNLYLSKRRIRSLTLPTLFISGLSDELVPPRMMMALYNECGSENKKIVTFPDGGHNDTWTSNGYYLRILEFLHQIRNHNDLSSIVQEEVDRESILINMQPV